MLPDIYQVRAVIRVYGDVQRVGFRSIVQDLARRTGVKGYVKNLPDGSVEIVAEASKEIVDKFVDAVRVKEPQIDAARLDVAYTEATGEYEHFSLVSGDLTEEILEGFGTEVKYINLSREENKEGFDRVEKRIKASIYSMHEDMNEHFGEMAKRCDVISSELIRTREELTRTLDNMSRLIDEFIKAREKQE